MTAARGHVKAGRMLANMAAWQEFFWLRQKVCYESCATAYVLNYHNNNHNANFKWK